MARTSLHGIFEHGKRDPETLADTVTLLRRVHAVVPGLEPSLAEALHFLARALSDDTQLERALAAVEEAIRLYRRGSAVRRSRRDARLARSLSVRSDILEDLGRSREAAVDALEAIALCRAGLPRDPRRFGPALLMALDTAARALDEIEEPEQALPLGAELVHILRRLAPHRPRYEPLLAGALQQLGLYSFHAGELGDALRATDEAVRLYRRLEDEQPESAAQQLDSAIGNRDYFLDQLELSGKVVLGPYPLCAECERTNGGLVAVRHRQIHVRAAGRESCVDHALRTIIARLWENGCDTRNSCQDFDSRAMVVPVAGQTRLAVEALARMGIHAEVVDTAVFFPLPTGTADGPDHTPFSEQAETPRSRGAQ